MTRRQRRKRQWAAYRSDWCNIRTALESSFKDWCRSQNRERQFSYGRAVFDIKGARRCMDAGIELLVSVQEDDRVTVLAMPIHNRPKFKKGK